MINIDIIDKKIVEKLFKNSDKFLLLIDYETKILDYNDTFNTYKDQFLYIKDFVSSSHQEELNANINKVINSSNPVKFISNFCFNKSKSQHIPNTYEVILSKKDDYILFIAEFKPHLSLNDANLYLSIMENYAKTLKKKYDLKKLTENLQKELEQKDKIILCASKNAAMGEMIDIIAHQWRNHLYIIRTITQSILIEYDIKDSLSIDSVLIDMTNIEKQTDHLIETIEEFRLFFRNKSHMQKVRIEDIINSVTVLMKDELYLNTVFIKNIGELDTQINIIPNEFKHILINLINNSIYAFNENKIENRFIFFIVENKNDKVIFKICDNAGGIPGNIIDKIFDADFTTKGTEEGTGLGLYLAKKICEKIGADISVYNDGEGACFTITFQ